PFRRTCARRSAPSTSPNSPSRRRSCAPCSRRAAACAIWCPTRSGGTSRRTSCMAILRKPSLAALALAAFAGCGPAAGGPGANGTIDNAAVCDAYAQHRSHVEVDAEGAVTRVLGTRPGRRSPHTGFLVRLRPCGVTVRVEANTDFTGVVPVRPSDDVAMRGEYEY